MLAAVQATHLRAFPQAAILIQLLKSRRGLRRTAVSVRDRGRAIVFPEDGVGMTRLLAISTTSLPLNFFSSSRTSRCCTLWKAFSSLYGTCDTRADHYQYRRQQANERFLAHA